MNLKKTFFTILTVGIFSGWLLLFLGVKGAMCMSGAETNWHLVLANAKEGDGFTSPKDFIAPKSPKTFQPQERDQEPPVIAPPITDPEMVITPPLTDPEMVVTPESIEPTEEENTPEDRRKD